MIDKATLDRIQWLYHNASEGPYDWDEANDRCNPPYIPQGSHLGNTLICLDDTYEGSSYDCALIQELLNNLPGILEVLSNNVKD